MTTLTTTDLAERYAAAVEAEEDARATLEALQTPESAGEEPSAAEREAEAALATAVSTTARLEVALTKSRQRDAFEQRAMTRAEVDHQDDQTISALTNVEKAAVKLTAALEAYVAAYDAFTRGVALAQQLVNENPRLAQDTWLPRPDLLTSEELGRLGVHGAQPPGSAFHSTSYPDISRIDPLANRYESYTRHFKGQLEAQRARRAAA
jgi:hypothetical protein